MTLRNTLVSAAFQDWGALVFHAVPGPSRAARRLRRVRRVLLLLPVTATLACATAAALADQDCFIWEEVSTQGPSGGNGRAMAYDSSRGVMVLHGGALDWNPYYSDATWEWDGGTWSLVSTAGPGPRAYHAVAYDSTRNVTVLFGGGYFHSGLGDTWEWQGSVWILRSTTGPSPRHAHAMVYDSARGVTVLFGGREGDTYLGDTWEWDGDAWHLVSTTGPSPRASRMAYDSGRGVTVLHGGSSIYYQPYAGTWEWDGSSWTMKDIAFGREVHAMAYDSARGVTILFGGRTSPTYYKGDTWEWDGSTWTLVATTGPSPRHSHVMGYDSARGVTTLFGGSMSIDDYDDTWEFVGGHDCNCNEIPDDEDIANGTSNDCNVNAVPDECDLAAGTSLDCNSNTVPDECDPTAAIVAAASVRDHAGTAHPVDLLSNNIESRHGGVTRIDFQTSEPVTGLCTFVSCLEQPYAGAVTTTPSDTTVTVEFSPSLPDQDCCQISFSGDLADTFAVRTLAGDVNRSGEVNTTDASTMKLRFGMDAATAGAQFDYNADGAVTTTDYSQVKLLFGHSTPDCP